jgi:hypothetical protein
MSKIFFGRARNHAARRQINTMLQSQSLSIVDILFSSSQHRIMPSIYDAFIALRFIAKYRGVVVNITAIFNFHNVDTNH